jgi:hypothetical protein
MDTDISETLSFEELESLTPYLLMRIDTSMSADEHNNAVIEAYLLGKIERENG